MWGFTASLTLDSKVKLEKMVLQECFIHVLKDKNITKQTFYGKTLFTTQKKSWGKNKDKLKLLIGASKYNDLEKKIPF